MEELDLGQTIRGFVSGQTVFGLLRPQIHFGAGRDGDCLARL